MQSSRFFFGAACAAALAAMASGCGSAGFKVPAAEVQRLAQLPLAERGQQVRVVPWGADTPPAATVAPGGQPPAPADVPPVAVAAAPDPYSYGGDVYLDVSVPVRAGGCCRSAAAPPPTGGGGGRLGGFRGSPIGASSSGRGSSSGGWRGSPPSSSAPSSPSPGRFSAPSAPSGWRAPSSGKSAKSGGGGGASDAVVAAVAVVAVVGLVAILASAAADGEKREAFARTFDGWVSVDPDQVLHLHYHHGFSREVPLSRLVPADTVGLRFGFLRASDGPVTPLNEPWAFRQPPAADTGARTPRPGAPPPAPPPTAAAAPPAPPPPAPIDSPAADLD